ncbi:MAG: TolC family protein [Acidobacteria bacterium]|nr:TolC family protein [Acidobacteriota bacterium]
MDELTLRDAVALALLRSPDLTAFSWEKRAREARVLQARRHPNPKLEALVENLGTDRDHITGGRQTTLRLGQLIELGGKRSARMAVASLELDVAGWDYEIARINLLSRVSRSFVDVLSAQRRTALAEEAVSLAERSAGVVSERVEAGKASPIEETKASVAVATARIGLDRTRRRLEASRRTLSATWGTTSPRFQSVVGDLNAIGPVPALDLLAQLLTRHPELALWATEVSLRQATVDLEEARRVPDLTVAGGYQRYSLGEGADTFLVGISIPLPLFNRNRGRIEEARHQEARAEEHRRAAHLRLGLALAASYEALSSAYSEVTALRDTVLPAAQDVFDVVTEGYRLGRFGLLDVLDSQRTLFDVRHQYLRAAADYHKAVVDVERLIGAPLDSAELRQDGDLPR